jgi:lauroyl/myristoyl acyltransferase
MSDLEATLAALERPGRHGPRVRGLSLRDRLELSPALGRLVPRELAVRRAVRSGERGWEDSDVVRRKAIKWMKQMLKRPGNDPEVRRLAREAVIDWKARRALLARSWEGGEGDVHGLEHLQRARAGGRGLILLALHLGLSWNNGLVVARHCGPYYIVKAPRDKQYRGRGAQFVKQRMMAMERAGHRWVERRGCYPVLRALLERGDMCGIAFDAAGRVETELAGHRTWLAGGSAALACEVGVPVSLSVTLREGSEQVTWFEEPVEPGDFAAPAELHSHLADVVGRWITAHLPQYFPYRFSTAPRPAPETRRQRPKPPMAAEWGNP